MTATSNYLKFRNGKFHFRMRVPADCRAQLGTEVTRDLGTAVRRDAERLARRLASEYTGLFAAIRAGAELGKEIEDPRAIAKEIADRHLRKLQRQLDDQLGATLGTSEGDEAAEAYDAAQDALRDLFTDGDYADVAAQIGSDAPAGALLNKAVIEAAVAAVIRRLGELSTNPDRPIATPSVAAAPPIVSPSSRARTSTGSAHKTLGDVLAALLAEKTAKGVWRDGKQQQGYRNAERFVEYMGAERAVDSIERSDVLAWLASCTNSKGEPVAPTTHNNLVAAVNMLFGHAVLNRWATWNPAQGMRAVDPRADHERRDAFTLEELQRLFGAEFVSWADRTQGGKQWTARRYVPLLMVGAGMRLREAAQLAVEDVFESEGGIWVAKVTHDVEDGGRGRGRRSAKNRSSRRLVPLHDEILRRGFLDFVKARKGEAKRPTEPLFPEMAGKHAQSSFSMSANNVLLPKLGLKRETTSIYSLRHSFITLTEQDDAPEKAVKQFVGHTLGSDAHAGYLKPRELKALAEVVFPAVGRWLAGALQNISG